MHYTLQLHWKQLQALSSITIILPLSCLLLMTSAPLLSVKFFSIICVSFSIFSLSIFMAATLKAALGRFKKCRVKSKANQSALTYVVVVVVVVINKKQEIFNYSNSNNATQTATVTTSVHYTKHPVSSLVINKSMLDQKLTTRSKCFVCVHVQQCNVTYATIVAHNNCNDDNSNGNI